MKSLRLNYKKSIRLNMKLPNEYAIKVNVEFVPTYFKKWIKLDTSEYKKNDVLKLNNYKSVVIKSNEQNILLKIGGINYIINQNWLYFPFFPKYHNCVLTLSPNINIYINPNYELDNNILKLNKFLMDNCVIFYNMKIIDEKTNKLMGSDKYLLSIEGMCGATMKKYVDFNIEKFYCEYEKINDEQDIDKAIINDDINFIDKYYQLEAIKICKFI